MTKEYANYEMKYPVIKDGKIVKEVVYKKVRVLARAEGWAMVRIPKGATLAVQEKELQP